MARSGDRLQRGGWLGRETGHNAGEAAQRQGVPPERISFVDALRWLATAQPGDEMPDLVVNPLRPGRTEPRVRKRRPKPFPNMTKPRAVLRQKLLEQRVGA